MPFHLRALAFDYDGTLAHGGRVSPVVLAGLARARMDGRSLVLVTGRILAELDVVFPEGSSMFDAVVGENGATLRLRGEAERPLAPALPRALLAAILDRGAVARQGRVLIATQARHAHVVLEEIARLGIDAVLMRNREELMVLPAGVTKGTGLHRALTDLGLSPHGCLAVGDAENDHALLEAAEIGAAVGDAVPALKARADLVLEGSNGDGIVELLRGPVLAGEQRLQPVRWRVGIGTFPDGSPVTLPGSRSNVLITGGSGSGKSYLMGLIAEELVHLGYVIAVLDLEGDHEDLAAIGGVHLTSAGAPERDDLLAAMRLDSLVLDLSLLERHAKLHVARHALAALARSRRARGVPHWIFIDEAHLPLAVVPEREEVTAGGLCAVTWTPDGLCDEILTGFDVRIESTGRRKATIAVGGRPPRPFTVGHRRSPHVRHRHKYAEAALAPHHRFFFRGPGGLTGRSAGNVAEFVDELHHAPDDVVTHHAASHDFSSWFQDVLQDRPLGLRVRALEDSRAGAAALRQAIAHAAGVRYQVH